MLSGVKIIPRDQVYSSGNESVSTLTSDYDEDRKDKQSKCKQIKDITQMVRNKTRDILDNNSPEDVEDAHPQLGQRRREVGLGWMDKPGKKINNSIRPTMESPLDEYHAEEVRMDNPKELNPYFTDNGSGFPEAPRNVKTGANSLFSSSVVGDGGASWRLKALKRSKEQAARDGRKFKEVVEERWGSLGDLAISAAARIAAPSHAHLHAIKNRKKILSDEREISVVSNERETGVVSNLKDSDREYLRDVSTRQPKMRSPKVHDLLAWGRQKSQKHSSQNSSIISTAVSSLNKFSNDGNFMHEFMHQENVDSGSCLSSPHPHFVENLGAESVPSELRKNNDIKSVVRQTLSANQLAAKALQLRLKGMHEESDKVLKEVESMKLEQNSRVKSIEQRHGGKSSVPMQERSNKQNDNADSYLRDRIIKNKQFNVSEQADEEYDFDDCPSKKSRKTKGKIYKVDDDKSKEPKRMLTQNERCHFCFENPNRPRHLVISIANFTYLMIPPSQQVCPGHCSILPLQHESASRTLDDNVLGEIRNFKKCLIMMSAKDEKDVVFLETVVELAQQRRHCLIECVPLPRDLARQAPLYFKKAIDEVEDEWSEHNAKRLIETREKGVRGCIPKGFPYFHVEFGLDKGFVHVIDDEKSFKKSFGLDVIRGMLRLPAEDMSGRRGRRESIGVQKQIVAMFARDWDHFDWTKQLS